MIIDPPAHEAIGSMESMPKDMAVCQNLVPLVKCKWMFIPLKMVFIGIDPYPYGNCYQPTSTN